MQEIGFAFPNIDPTAISIGPVSVQWYGLAYLASLLLGMMYIKKMARTEALWAGPHKLTNEMVDNLTFYTFLGVFFGGRLGYVLFYNLDKYLANPIEIFSVWDGGMSMHGGILFSALIILVFAHLQKIHYRQLFDVLGAVLPIGHFLGRIANFINGELWGRVTDVAWAVRFPAGGGEPRHPSQLYESLLEGLLSFIILWVLVWKFKGLKRPGLVAGVSAILYGSSRIFVEFFRVPDAQIGYYFGFITQGMILSMPLILLGVWLISTSNNEKLKQA
ncbi:MAG: prolipoprotein diacylglyceryl transferase [Alphaproteobacteria bacterium]|nr:prolipoprotein diacylglyceryl transferase [Alphaproteobacteria bacterium]